MKKKIIVITGGAGFVGSNLINLLLKKTKFKIVSIDNYSSGSFKNHIKSNRVNNINFSDFVLTLRKSFSENFNNICCEIPVNLRMTL